MAERLARNFNTQNHVLRRWTGLPRHPGFWDYTPVKAVFRDSAAAMASRVAR